MKIEKKTWPEFFEKVVNGEKNFDVRLNDFECKSGDTLVLREWDPENKKYTGRILEKKVSFVLNTKELEKFWSKKDIEEKGFQIIGLSESF